MLSASRPKTAASITALIRDSGIPPAYGRSITLRDDPVPGQGALAATMDRHGIGRVERDIDQTRIVLQCR